MSNQGAGRIPGATIGVAWVGWVAASAGAAWAADSNFRAETYAAGIEFEESPTAGLHGIAGATHAITARVFLQARYGVWRAEANEFRVGVDYSCACIRLFACPYLAICEPSLGADLGLEVDHSGFHLRFPFGGNPIPAGIVAYPRPY